MKIAVAMLERLEQEVAWEQGTGNARITLRKGRRARGNKRVTVIKNHVIIVGKKPGARVGRDGELHEPVEIEWTHRWSVRGHWRSVPGFGKDARGKYNQFGRTWVKPHEKGPTGLPYVKKVRLVAA